MAQWYSACLAQLVLRLTRPRTCYPKAQRSEDLRTKILLIFSSEAGHKTIMCRCPPYAQWTKVPFFLKMQVTGRSPDIWSLLH